MSRVQTSQDNPKLDIFTDADDVVLAAAFTASGADSDFVYVQLGSVRLFVYRSVAFQLEAALSAAVHELRHRDVSQPSDLVGLDATRADSQAGVV